MNTQTLSMTSVSRLSCKTGWKEFGWGCLLLFFSISVFADTHYVSLSGAHIAPFTDWSTAATNVQSAVDAAEAGDTVLVSNGVYDTGGRPANGVLTNRVMIDKPLVVRSVNGPELTLIKGAGPEGDAAVRCVYLGTNAILIGFTLTNGHTRGQGGGVFCEPSAVLSNCVLTGNSAYDSGGGAYDGRLYNCVLTGNSASSGGGGALWGTLYNCTLTGNSSYSSDGGGTYGSVLYGCILTGNSANSGGGALGGMLNNCTLTGNSANFGGGGASGSTLNNCTLTGNSANFGGGTSGSMLNNCTLTGNSANSGGGGASESTLNNCTLTGNSANSGGGASGGTLYNCIVYYNAAPNGSNFDNSALNYCCTTPDPGGEGNITDEPLLADVSHLSAGSPCIGRGNAAYASGTDIDGEAWSSPPSIGCDEVHAGAVTGPLNVTIVASSTNVSVGFIVDFMALIEGRTTASRWNFGNGIVISNHPHASHAWSSPGVYPVVLTAWNESIPQGVSATMYVTVVVQPIHYVRVDSPAPAFPFVTWETAASNIQDAVDAATTLGALVLVSNGVYDTGGRPANGVLTNRVVINKPLVVCSVNGPKATLIKGTGPTGDAAIRCVYLGTNATLIGFTLTSGHTRTNSWNDGRGGGVFCEPSAVLSNCVLTGNSAYDSGGGASDGRLYNCVLTGNSASSGGGGARWSTLYNCTLTGNSASYGGGAYESTLYNCIVYYNAALYGLNFSDSTLNYCCTTPDPGGVGNITKEPLLADVSHLSAGSPCIGRGNAAYASGIDIDGEAWSSPPSIGCDEVHAGAVTGPLNVTIAASSTNVGVGFKINFTTLIEGRTTASRWNFGDGIVISNHPHASHAWSSPGVYPVVLTAWNESIPQGVSTTMYVTVVVQPIHYVRADSPAPAFPFVTWETAASNIQDAVDAAEAGDTVLVTNGIYDTGGRTAHGTLMNRLVIDKPLVVRSVNGPEVTIIKGVGSEGYTEIRCVYLGTDASLMGFTLANGYAYYGSGGGVFCESSAAVLSNCVLTGNSAYGGFGGACCGGTLYNCTLTGNSTRWYGGGGGVYNSTLYKCTLTGNQADFDGGGAYKSMLYNCTLTGNSALEYGGGIYFSTLNSCILTSNGAYEGGGAYTGTLYNCILSGNYAGYYGGGAYDSALYNCTLTGNSARWSGGGVSGGTLYNCIIYYNTSYYGHNFAGGTLNYCCTIPDPEGTGNITDVPLFMDYVGGNLRLQSHSPCINAGTNQDWLIGTTDLDGNPRIYGGGRVDMGACEYQSSLSVIPTNWLAQYGLPSDGSADHGDADGDSMDNWQEWRCNTDPTSRTSFLHFTTSVSEGTAFVMRWQSAEGVRYRLNRSTNLITDDFSYLVRTNIVATPSINTETDKTAVGCGPWFYRVELE